MLELRPSCEHCNTLLPPESTQAMICSYECTFCKTCVEEILENVCPNCGGGFAQRPIRPSQNRKAENYLARHPASTTPVYKPVDIEAHRMFAARIKQMPAEQR